MSAFLFGARRLHWGATDAEVRAELPGDDLIPSADRVVPEWQNIAVGDEVRLAPDVRLKVAVAEPGRTLVLRGGVPIGQTPPPYDFTWSFSLRDEPGCSTRVLVRERYAYKRCWARPIVEVAELMSQFMSQKMLRNLRDRAQSSPLPASGNGRSPAVEASLS
jgi:hypothetical protein